MFDRLEELEAVVRDGAFVALAGADFAGAFATAFLAGAFAATAFLAGAFAATAFFAGAVVGFFDAPVFDALGVAAITFSLDKL